MSGGEKLGSRRTKTQHNTSSPTFNEEFEDPHRVFHEEFQVSNNTVQSHLQRSVRRPTPCVPRRVSSIEQYCPVPPSTQRVRRPTPCVPRTVSSIEQHCPVLPLTKSSSSTWSHVTVWRYRSRDSMTSSVTWQYEVDERGVVGGRRGGPRQMSRSSKDRRYRNNGRLFASLGQNDEATWTSRCTVAFSTQNQVEMTRNPPQSHSLPFPFPLPGLARFFPPLPLPSISGYFKSFTLSVSHFK